MINELHSLSETLSDVKISLKADHHTRRSMPNGKCFCIWIDNEGIVSNVELLSAEFVKSISKFGDNQSTFPAFNIAPLYRVSSGSEKKIIKDVQLGNVTVDDLKAICISDNWGKKLLNKVNACLHKQFPDMKSCPAVHELLNICNTISASEFRASLEKLVWEKLKDKVDIDICLSLLVFEGNPKKDDKPEDDSGTLSVVLDLLDWEKYSDPVASKITADLMNDVLVEADKEISNEETYVKSRDAFGAEYCDIGKTMPSVEITSGFNVTLRSMFNGQHCQFRYKNADDKSYPITLENRMQVQTALQWIAKPENNDIMWRKADESSILFVYPDKLPPTSPKFAAVFGGSTLNTAERFEDISKEFLKVLKGMPLKEKPDNIRVFTLRQIPPALSKRAKIDVSHRLTTDALAEAAGDWEKGFGNIPAMERILPIILFPLQVYGVLNQVWKRDGETKKSVPQMRYYQGVEIMLGLYDYAQLEHDLRGLIANCEGLIVYAGNQLPRAKIGNKHESALGKLIPLLGLLLYKLNCVKENYMENSAFLLGQVLKISDSLHELYCKEKRNGDIPPQLVGNSVFITSSENPGQALALLGTRMCPYISWAKQSKSGLAWWHLKLFEDVMSKLHLQITTDLRYSDIDKAQLFIGYLAKLPKSEDTIQSINDTEQENKEDKKQ